MGSRFRLWHISLYDCISISVVYVLSCIFVSLIVVSVQHSALSMSLSVEHDTDAGEDFGNQEQTSTELVHCICSSTYFGITNMQQSCSSCLVRRIWGMKGTRSYGVVPKPPSKAKPTEATVRRSPRARFGLSNPSTSNERVDQRPHSDPRMTEGTSRADKAEQSSRPTETRGARRSRLAGFLDEDGTSTPIKLREYSPRTTNATMTSEASRKGHPTRNDGRQTLSGNAHTSGYVRRPLYPSTRNSASEVAKTRQSTRESLDTSTLPSHSAEPSSSRRNVSSRSEQPIYRLMISITLNPSITTRQYKHFTVPQHPQIQSYDIEIPT